MKGNPITRLGYGDVSTPDPDEMTITADIASNLLERKEVEGLVSTYNFSGLMQRIWDNVDDSEEIEKALRSIALGDSELAPLRIRKIITRSANEMASDIEADVIAAIVEKNRIASAEWLADQRDQDREYHL